MLKTLAVTAVLVVAFFAGFAPAKVAIVAGAVLLLTRAVKPEKVYAQIDWTLLLMFAGLFIVVAGPGAHLAHAADRRRRGATASRAIPRLLSGVTAVLSNLVSNVPAVLVLRSFVTHLHDPQRAWLVVAMASTLAGNFTILGSVANLIVVQRARQEGVAVRFWNLFRGRRATHGAHDPGRHRPALTHPRQWLPGRGSGRCKDVARHGRPGANPLRRLVPAAARAVSQHRASGHGGQ